MHHTSQIILRQHPRILERHLFQASSRFFSDKSRAHPPPPSQPDQMAAIFAGDSTFMLVKKLIIYRTMSSNLFINHALTGMNASYKVLGRTLTNLIINKTAGEVFTSGETLQTLIDDMKQLEERKVFGVANYVVEGLHSMHEPTILKVYDDLIESIKALTEGGKEGHLAIKLTSMITIEIMSKISKA
jgi:hypothetical protein